MAMMVPHSHRLAAILAEDQRYAPAAYVFVFDALQYAQEVLGLGKSPTGEPEERHVTGQELCQAIRLYALEQFGYMAKCVLNNWGIYQTGDFGEIVYNLIRHGQMKKTDADRREDFDDVFDFERDLEGSFKISPVE